MDKSWMNLSRAEPEYIQGVIDFIEFACKNLPAGATEIICPCRSCRNVALVKIDVVKEHLLMPGISTSYTRWIFHGEKPVSSEGGVESNHSGNIDGRDEINAMLLDAFGIVPPNHFHDFGMGVNDQPCAGIEGPDEETKTFFDRLKEADRKLYPECQKFSLLSFVVRLMHIKCLSGWSNNSFTLLLKLLKDAFPEGETLPGSFHATKKMLQGLGLDYYKIHACSNDCMLYWGENANRTDCKKCHKPRYKQFEQQDEPNKGNVPIPQKIVRYFPLIPKLKRLFTSSKTAPLMTWHAENPSPHGTMRHPVDSGAWKHFDELYPDFSLDPRNVRLGLASDGFNPFRTMNISHSTWPVVLMTYNLPPWLCMKQPYMMLCLLIDGPKAPGNDIDVYLSLVVDELKELWDKGVDTYDAATNKMFKMRALLLWTINDFPAYANLSGWSTKGRFACPCCHVNTRSQYLSHSRKMCYMGHRRWLDMDHKFRTDCMSFDGTTELDMAPTRLSGSNLLAMFPTNYENNFGKHDEDVNEDMQTRIKRKAPKKDCDDGDPESLYNLKKKSIFLMELPYWKDNLIRHNLDVMHIEKNVCDNVLSTIFDSDHKGKDGENARLDLQEMGIRKRLHPQSRVGKRPLCPIAPFTMEKKQKTMLCKFLKKVKVPDGYASNISRCLNVKRLTINGLKSHDSHILMEQLLPIAVSRTLPSRVSKPIIELCNFFRLICSKVLEVAELDRLQSRIALTLCHLEQIFTPTFFNSMEHLPIHLAEEAKIGGPVRFRWMYFVERYLMTLKNYVRNRAKPEGSIAEGYMVEECMTFCSRYLNDVESKLNRPIRNFVGVGQVGRALGKEEKFIIGDMHKNQAHRYILFNTDVVAPYREKHRQFLQRVNIHIKDRELDLLHHKMFPLWFQKHVHNLQVSKCEQVTDEIAELALGPRDTASRYSGYYLNGVKYHTKQREARRKTQNSGVMMEADTSSYASAKDKNPQVGRVMYYGKICDIVELYYMRNRRYLLFKCDWIDNNKGLKEEDAFGFTLVNFKHLLYPLEHASNEPFILAYQAQQIFYIQDPAEEDWNIVLQMKPRDLYEACTQLPTEAEIITDVEVEGIRHQQLDDDALDGLHDDLIRDD